MAPPGGTPLAGLAGGSGAGGSTGGGGGGGGDNPSAVGANGGSGVFILRYPDSFPTATSTTGSPTVTTSGGYRYYKFTGSGSITF